MNGQEVCSHLPYVFPLPPPGPETVQNQHLYFPFVEQRTGSTSNNMDCSAVLKERSSGVYHQDRDAKGKLLVQFAPISLFITH